LVKAEGLGITVDGQQEAVWNNYASIGRSENAGFESFQIDNLKLANDAGNLYFWVDAKSVPNWGDNGMYIDLALNINGVDSGVEGNPWGSKFNFSGTSAKPNYHITFRVKGDSEVNGAAVYSSSNLGNPILSTWTDKKGAEFAVDRTKGFEGKIPFSALGLKSGDKIKAAVVLTGNEGKHGAFDSIPEIEGNVIANNYDMTSAPNMISNYTNDFVVTNGSNLGIVVDGQKDIVWNNYNQVGKSDNAGFEGFHIDYVKFSNDTSCLYFWVDAKNLPNWGDNGMYIDLALNINGVSSGVDGNPWGSKFNFSGTSAKPNYHITFRVKGDSEVNGAALYSSSDLGNPILATWTDKKGAEFAVDRTKGFEGKIPLSVLGLKDGDRIKAIAVLSGNEGKHGAFDVIPEVESNTIANGYDMTAAPNVLATYSNEYNVSIIGTFVTVLEKIIGEDVVASGNTSTFKARLSSEDGNGTDGQGSEFSWSVVNEDNSATNFASIDANGTLTANQLLDGAFARKVKVRAVRKSNPSEIQEKTVIIAREKVPKSNNDGTVTFKAEHSGPTLNLVGSMNGWNAENPIAMTKNAEGFFEVTIPLGAKAYEYKFIPNKNWTVSFRDQANPNTAGDNSYFIHTGLRITNNDDMQAGSAIDLTAKLVSGDASEVDASPVWSLKAPVAGISLIGNKLTTTKEVANEAIVTVVAEQDNYRTEKNIKILQEMFTYNIHYYRYDNRTLDWALWVWEDGKEGALKNITTQNADGFGYIQVEYPVKELNIIPRPKDSWVGQESAKKVRIQSGESVDVYLLQDSDQVFYEKPDTSPRVTSAIVDDIRKILVGTTAVVTDSDLTSFKLVDKTDNKDIAVTARKLGDLSVELTVNSAEEINPTHFYEVSSSSFAAGKATMRRILDEAKYFYNGSDLGLSVKDIISLGNSLKQYNFKVWAPTAVDANVLVYNDDQTQTAAETIKMDRLENGVWTSEKIGELDGKFYMYEFTFADGIKTVAIDPYGKSVSVNGKRTAILNVSGINPENWGTVSKPAMIKATDAILYEMHVRDFSISANSGMDNKGKFQALTEEGTTLPGDASIKTGVDSLKELRVTHVHLLPSFDYKSVDEASSAAQFNWGYDPQNYNVPEGSYASSAVDPAVRVKEFKEMVQALHKAGIRVVMDVVYNHTFEIGSSPFDAVVPGYFYRTTDAGRYTNGSGCGNEVASERPMVRKYIKDSVKYWANEYGVDGFRFDLMGLIDTTTMEQLTKELQEEVDPTILVYGEPWQAGGSPLPGAMQTTKGTQKDKNFSVFNDNFRGAIKGDSDMDGQGFATGAAGKEADIIKGVRGAIEDFTNGPTEAINYVTAHDNLNLWDKIIKSQSLDDEAKFVHLKDGALDGASRTAFATVEEAVAAADPYNSVDRNNVLGSTTVRRALLANGIVLTSQGIPFFQAGDEFLRTKYGDHNSYKSSDAINKINWQNKKDFKQVFDYHKGLIELRKAHPAFRMDTKAAVESGFEVVRADGNVVAFKLKNYANNDTWKNIAVIYNANTTEQTVDLKESADWKIVVDHTTAGTRVIRNLTSASQVSVAPLSMMVLYDESEVDYTPVATSIQLSKNSMALEAGGSSFVSAYVKDQKGRIMPGKVVAWSTENRSIATVSETGKITAISNGSTKVIAAVDSIKAELVLNVGELVPTVIAISGGDLVYTTQTISLSAVVKDQYNQTMLGVTPLWTSSDTSIAEVNSKGEVSALKEGTVTITAAAGDAVATKVIQVKKYERRYIRLTYVRPDKNYTGWNLWIWGTGVKDGQIDFTVNNGVAVASIEVAPGTSKVGFIVRKGDWEAKDIDADRSITLDVGQTLTKVVVTSGQAEFYTVPEVTAPVLDKGIVTFNYRDEALYQADEMGTLTGVKVKFGDNEYPMTYVSKDELYTYSRSIEPGTYEYSYIVTDKDGVTKEITDPSNTINGKSVVTYVKPRITITAEVSPNIVDYDQNAVVSLNLTSDQEVSVRDIYIDLTSIGGPSRVKIDSALMEHAVSVKDTVAAGEKVLPIIVIDEFGNEHSAEVKLAVRDRQSSHFGWDEARIYFMVTDRFANGDTSNDNPNGENYNKSNLETYHGGDFKGVTSKLDYLKNLGINTVWITPIVDNIDFNQGAGFGGSQYAYHGYWAKNFEALDEHLGDINEFKALIDAAHDRGIKIMVDVVLNHSGYGLKETDTNVKGITNYPTGEDKLRFEAMLRAGGTDQVQGELAGLPDFKTEEAAVREKLIEWQTAWINKARTDKGNTIDYFRVDTVKHVDHTTWKAFKNALTKINPNFKMVGEYFEANIGNADANTFLRSGEMDSLLDFAFKYSALNFVNGQIDSVEGYMEEINGKIDNTASYAKFLSSHDEDGFLTRLTGTEAEKLAKLKAAAALQMTAKGQPVIYYGEELGLSGKNAGDMAMGQLSENRYDMDFSRLNNPLYKSVYDHYSKLLNIRADYSKIFAKGTRTKLAGSDADKYIVFGRSYKDESVVVAINTDTTAKSVTTAVPFEAATKLKDVYSGTEYTVSADKKVTFSLPATKDGATVILAKVSEDTNGTGGSTGGTNSGDTGNGGTTGGNNGGDNGAGGSTGGNNGGNIGTGGTTGGNTGTGGSTGGNNSGNNGSGTDTQKTVENIPTKVLEAIKAAPAKAEIVINVTNNMIADKSIFEEIKGTDKAISFTSGNATWTFSGKDISVVKDIDLSLSIATLENTLTSNKQAIAEKVKAEDVLVFSFADNGKLPGKAKVKLKMDAAWLEGKDMNNIYIYYYNEATKKVEVIAEKLKVDSQGYIEFEITHNSDYFAADKDLVKAGVLPKTGAVIDTFVLGAAGFMTMFIGVLIVASGRRKREIEG
jgi:pullulanase